MAKNRKKAIPLTFEEQQEQTRLANERKAEQRRQAEARIARAEAEKAAKQAANASLRVQGAKIVENAAGDMIGGFRRDCFTMLLKDMPQEANAVRWLEALMRDASGENGIERRPDFIRASSEGAPGQTVSQVMIDASRHLEIVRAGLRPWEWKLLSTLLAPDAALITRWRPAVQAITGEANPHAQGSRVRSACEGLRFVREEIESRPRLAA